MLIIFVIISKKKQTNCVFFDDFTNLQKLNGVQYIYLHLPPFQLFRPVLGC